MTLLRIWQRISLCLVKYHKVSGKAIAARNFRICFFILHNRAFEWNLRQEINSFVKLFFCWEMRPCRLWSRTGRGQTGHAAEYRAGHAPANTLPRQHGRAAKFASCAGTTPILARSLCMEVSVLPDQPYCGPAPLPGTVLRAWNDDVVLIALLAVLCVIGVWYLRAAPRARQGAFAVAALTAVIAFLSPLCAMTVALFSARSLHHLVVMSVLGPALALALPFLRVPAGASFAALSVVLWVWHVPGVYSAVWDSAALYWALQLALLLPAWAFWSVVLHRRTLASIIWLGPLVGQMGALGAVLTFANRPFYLEHLALAERFGLSALEDQQLAGLVMWVPGMLPIAALAGLMAWRALRVEGLA